MSGVLESLRPVNVSRLARWHGDIEWHGADWSNAMCGEAGEVANVVKKLRRHETGAGTGYRTPDEETLLAALREELADVVIYADLLAHHYNIDLADVIVEKFNYTSEVNGHPERLAHP